MSVRIMTAAWAKRPGTRWRRRAFAEIVERDGSHCAECGRPDRTIWRKQGLTVSHDWPWPEDAPWARPRLTIVYPTSVLEVDHRRPLSEGGCNDIANLWLLCVDCHKRKTSSERSARLKALFAEARA